VKQLNQIYTFYAILFSSYEPGQTSSTDGRTDEVRCNLLCSCVYQYGEWRLSMHDARHNGDGFI